MAIILTAFARLPSGTAAARELTEYSIINNAPLCIKPWANSLQLSKMMVCWPTIRLGVAMLETSTSILTNNGLKWIKSAIIKNLGKVFSGWKLSILKT